ncbi:DUF262 domain-containing HNH endonuclease family protein [Capnocytophaga gingivalis]|jgi:hypothetical protein|uniref:DUF262 domain-containing HNH endonuclease family protein n=1 Tax=Capnocytophaga gingivalis TaxID=1017 RepID=A0ABU5ZDA0_9FLAO|nr:DUF262 domain-containing HNH endonuclease family protein [Capnocytophaga gingivalis]MEB3075486.1 DUF262 domain-containing HNH endonuclease family protein [Capnocytophaga gingivalis]
MDAGKRTINDIFNGNRVLEIPFFQRSYVWGIPQWERLLEDMKAISSSNKPYFLGSVILKQQETTTGSRIGDKRTVIDGQQRLTTLNIFFKVLCLKTNENFTFDRSFKLRDNSNALLHNHNDIQAFDEILALTELKDLEGESNITQAYNYFKDNLVPNELNLDSILSNVLFVGIDLSQEEDEQQIFDTINSLGVKLTTAELLKNYFFNRDDIEKYNKYWKEVFEKDEETKNYWDREITAGRLRRTFIDLFFFAYLQIKIQEPEFKVKAEDKDAYVKVEHLFESYKNFIKNYFNNNKEAFLSEIKEYALLFKKNFNYEILGEDLTQDFGIDRINTIIFGLDTTTLIPYTLYILRNISDEITKNELFGIIETYIMRRMITHSNTKNYNQLFTDKLINNRVLSKQEFLDYVEKREDKVNFLPTDEELEKGFNTSILINKQAAGILYLIESKIRNEKDSTALLGINKYSLEHLMPKKWRNNWDKLSSKESEINRDRKLLTLGNLTIITQSLNSSIRDSKWEDKLKGKNKKGGLIEYSVGLKTISQFLKYPEWNEKTIEERALFLYEKAKQIWKI